MISRISLVVGLLLAACPFFGQAPQKAFVVPEKYPLWHNLALDAASDDGTWVSYYIRYEGQQDTLFLRDVKTRSTIPIPRGSRGKFGRDFYVCHTTDSEIAVIDLRHTGKRKVLDNIVGYEILPGSSNILAASPVTKNTGTYNLRIVDPRGHCLDSISNVTGHLISDDRNSIIYTDHWDKLYRLRSYDPKGRLTTTLYTGTSPIHTMDSSDNRIGFLTGTDESGIAAHLYNHSNKKVLSFIPQQKDALTIAKDLGLTISKDGSKVFLGSSEKSNVPKQKSADVEVWNTGDTLIYPWQKVVDNRKNEPVLSVWTPSSGTVERIVSHSLETVNLSYSGNFAVLQKFCPNGQDGKMFGDADVYIKDLRTGSIKLVIKAHNTDTNMLRLSPVNDSMVYYHNESWWCYDMQSGMNTNLTAAIRSEWDNKNDSTASQLLVYGNPAWTDDGHDVLIHDSYDLWKISTDGKISRRMTRGKETGMVFRLDAGLPDYKDLGRVFSPARSAKIDLDAPFILQAQGQENQKGYYIGIGGGIHKLVYGSFITDQLFSSKNGQFFCRVQSFSQPFGVVGISQYGTFTDTIVQSNAHQKNYHWGSGKMVHYKGPQGEDLKAALLYPAGYDPSKKYPMIVDLYQIRSPELYEYVVPSIKDYVGFNPTNYTLDGYLVLLPDIAYKMGEPCLSATYCIEAAVNEVCAQGIADISRMGIIGHSFGGYEVNCILGRSGLFAAAVSGAGISDPIGYYFSSCPTFLGSESWRFEYQQFRMRSSFYDDRNGYVENSPIFKADSIRTPLLLWAGKEDEIIPYGQSLVLYHALRRLDKECIMLLYPNESHVLEKPENQADLSLRIKQWFDRLLQKKV